MLDMFHFMILALIWFISSPFCSGITISSAFLEFISGIGFTILSTILFPIYSPVASAVLWTSSVEAVFTAVSNNFYHIC